MKKILIPLLLLVCASLIISSLGFGKEKEISLETWLGKYNYTECIPNSIGSPSYPHVPCINYNISIYEEESNFIAEIINQGYQSNLHVSAKVIGDSKKIDLIFENYYKDNLFENYSEGDLLLSFELINNQIYTKWHQIKSENAIKNSQNTGIYFEKIN